MIRQRSLYCPRPNDVLPYRMLTAFIHGKGRRAPEDVPAGASLRKALSASEDMLTAAVFERLAYLNDNTLWELLQRTFRLPLRPHSDRAQLTALEFWPTFTGAAERLGQSVEPDLIVRFAFPSGSPLALIIECKLGAAQDPHQWAREWLAYQAEDGREPDEEVYLLALGGLSPHRASETVERFGREITKRWRFDIKAAAAEWIDLLSAIDAIEATTCGDRRALADVKDALKLFGFRRFHDLQDLAGDIWPGRPYCRALSHIGRLT